MNDKSFDPWDGAIMRYSFSFNQPRRKTSATPIRDRLEEVIDAMTAAGEFPEAKTEIDRIAKL